MQRAAQEGNTAPDGLAAGKAGYGLIYHRLENGSCKVCFGGALSDQGLDIRLGKHAAAGSNGIDLFVILCCIIQTLGIGLQQRCHLVDKGTGAAGADTIHPFLQPTGEINNLGIFTAQLNGHVGLGSLLLQGGGNRHHLLNKIDVQRLAQIDGA